jgi:hypothetical protein
LDTFLSLDGHEAMGRYFGLSTFQATWGFSGTLH